MELGDGKRRTNKVESDRSWRAGILGLDDVDAVIVILSIDECII